jgi:3-deoxy-D-manno-octulosonate cytidylyltransferase
MLWLQEGGSGEEQISVAGAAGATLVNSAGKTVFSAPMSTSRPASAVIVIPARLSSQRLPRKMLLDRTGHPLVEHTYRAAKGATLASGVVVATDSEEIAAAVRRFGGEAVMTSPEAPSGTARIVEALDALPAAEVIVNVQGDEPELSPAAIDAAIALVADCPAAGVATLVTPMRHSDDLRDPAAVKAVLTPWRDAAGAAVAGAWRAIYFSRAPVPAARERRAPVRVLPAAGEQRRRALLAPPRPGAPSPRGGGSLPLRPAPRRCVREPLPAGAQQAGGSGGGGLPAHRPAPGGDR